MNQILRAKWHVLCYLQDSREMSANLLLFSSSFLLHFGFWFFVQNIRANINARKDDWIADELEIMLGHVGCVAFFSSSCTIAFVPHYTRTLKPTNIHISVSLPSTIQSCNDSIKLNRHRNVRVASVRSAKRQCTHPFQFGLEQHCCCAIC